MTGDSEQLGVHYHERGWRDRSSRSHGYTGCRVDPASRAVDRRYASRQADTVAHASTGSWSKTASSAPRRRTCWRLVYPSSVHNGTDLARAIRQHGTHDNEPSNVRRGQSGVGSAVGAMDRDRVEAQPRETGARHEGFNRDRDRVCHLVGQAARARVKTTSDSQPTETVARPAP